ncbi:hypothetical protein [Streptomyces sp. NPDC049949]|uniref:hypothetical protein n=1 Tax=Streptomyces sp. NPDC049949 TaxID=3154627 RepID=UPI003448C1E8
MRKPVPDYLVLADDGPVVVDVKPRHRLERPEVWWLPWTLACSRHQVLLHIVCPSCGTGRPAADAG